MKKSTLTRITIMIVALVIILAFLNIYLSIAAAIVLLLYLNHKGNLKNRHEDIALFQQGEH